MPAYSFQERFVGMILDGSKGQTIRRRRRRATRGGDLLTLYCGLRTRKCRAICVTECVEVTPVVIEPGICRLSLVKEDVAYEQGPEEVLEIAKADGFFNAFEFFEFFDERYGGGRLFYELDDFEIVKWNVERLFPLWHSDELQEIYRRMSAAERRQIPEAWFALKKGIKNVILKVELMARESLINGTIAPLPPNCGGTNAPEIGGCDGDMEVSDGSR